MKLPRSLSCVVVILGLLAPSVRAAAPVVPDWAQPGSATHRQVPPPADFRRATTVIAEPIGVFTGQADVGSAVVPGSASFDPKTQRYTINSAGYNIWYTRDEFRYLWTKLSGDVSLAANITFPIPEGYGDRKVVLIVRQDLDDDAQEIMAGLHGAGLIHLAQRPTKGANIKEDHRLAAPESAPAAGAVPAVRLGLEKHGDKFTLYVSRGGEPLHPIGEPVTLKFTAPFYVGIGFCSHLPATSDTAVVSNVVLKDSAGQVR